MELLRLTADDDALMDQWLALLERTKNVDHPDDSRISHRANRTMLRFPEPGFAQELYVAIDDGPAVGVVELNLPTMDNLDNALIDINVDPQHRREGIGRALYDFGLDRVRTLGRSRILGAAREPLPEQDHPGWGGAEFATALGFRRVLVEVRRRLDVTAVDEQQLAEIEADSWKHADEYTIVEWLDGAPEELLDGLVTLELRMSTDAPLGDMTWEQEVIDGERVRAMEQALVARGRRAYCAAAIHTSGEVAGTTRIVADDDVPEQGWQWNTIVLGKHRGHRLGMLLKLANLRQARRHRPELRVIDTWNAAENTYMIAINEAMGFRPYSIGAEWQLELERPS